MCLYIHTCVTCPSPLAVPVEELPLPNDQESLSRIATSCETLGKSHNTSEFEILLETRMIIIYSAPL